MLNTKEFTTRIKKIMDFYDLSASVFADKIGVQRSSISHIISGRNKPSLDFILKVTSTFAEVDIHWLLNGKGEFPKNVAQPKIQTPSSPTSYIPQSNSTTSKKIERIVVFYNDGTFDEYLK